MYKRQEKTYSCKYLCDLVELRGAKTVMTYGSDFYAGYPALTVNSYGKGQAWYVAADAEKEFQENLIRKIAEQSGISCGVEGEIPKDLEVTSRETEKERFYIYQNWGREEVSLDVYKRQEMNWQKKGKIIRKS